MSTADAAGYRIAYERAGEGPPVLLVHGYWGPADVGRDLHARIPGSRLVIMEGVWHVSNVEGAERFDAEVRAFLRAA